MGKKITLELDADVVVQATEDHGGYIAGKCVLCGSHGWMDSQHDHGYPYGSKKGAELGNRVKHEKNCPMNAHLNDDGSLRG